MASFPENIASPKNTVTLHYMGAGKGRAKRAHSVAVKQKVEIPVLAVPPSCADEDDITSEAFLSRPFFDDWSEEEYAYLYNGCGAFAYALHQRTGWPMYGLVTAGDLAQTPFPDPYHVYLMHPSGQKLDAEGLSPLPKSWDEDDNPD